ncbi:MAG: hypothetical protein ACXVB9_06980 [Bdellovibrionota bacterium]
MKNLILATSLLFASLPAFAGTVVCRSAPNDSPQYQLVINSSAVGGVSASLSADGAKVTTFSNIARTGSGFGSSSGEYLGWSADGFALTYNVQSMGERIYGVSFTLLTPQGKVVFGPPSESLSGGLGCQ